MLGENVNTSPVNLKLSDEVICPIGLINELVADKTVILIAHRLNTIQNADQIIVLGQGQLVEQGTHAQVLDYSGIYARLWQLQQNA
ncbi:ABC-type multidrug transport system fused ATPase/permease subunit [Paenibacillus xylanexedens]|uniref:ABC-type multidrug transport system fused ATPase/permease subunit n=1 Tax=Paenibacillus xylanexedens TaxID=528191 RepID=A0ABS4RWC2_PAEXY|nr:ABC-type multidrug transport system fused ATPase/permease subunit [Paenibacillus xylanexedens]